MAKKTYLNWKGEKIVNCEKGEGRCNKPEHYTKRQHEDALARNKHYMSQLPEDLTLEQLDSDGDGYISYRDYMNNRPDNVATEGVVYGRDVLEPMEIPEEQYFKSYIEDAVKAGFKVFKPKHVYNRDNSVQIEKRIPEMKGKILIRFSDRYDKTLEGSTARKNHGEYWHMVSCSAWFVGDSPAGYALSEHGLAVDVNSDSKFDLKEWTDAAGRCDGCKKVVGRLNLEHVAFANNFCHDCAPAARDQLETPGWYN